MSRDGPREAGAMKAGDGTGHDGTSDDVGEVMAALADPTRRAILDLIAEAGEATATAAARTLPVSRQAVVKHVAVLEQAGLVDSRRRGREVLFSVRPERLETTADRLRRTASEWDARLRAIRRIAEGEGPSILPSILACVFLLLSACGDGASEGGGEPAYIEVVEAPTLVDDDDLIQIRDLRTDAEDRIGVVSRHAPLVRVYGSDEGRIAAFGELGDGPEEFRLPPAMRDVYFGDLGAGAGGPGRFGSASRSAAAPPGPGGRRHARGLDGLRPLDAAADAGRYARGASGTGQDGGRDGGAQHGAHRAAHAAAMRPERAGVDPALRHGPRPASAAGAQAGSGIPLPSTASDLELLQVRPTSWPAPMWSPHSTH